MKLHKNLVKCVHEVYTMSIILIHNNKKILIKIKIEKEMDYRSATDRQQQKPLK